MSAVGEIDDGDGLVARAKRGDRAAFDAMVARVRGAIQAVAFGRTGSREDAEDLTQQFMLRAWQSLPSLHSENRWIR